MLGTRAIRSSRRQFLVTVYVALSLLAVQALKIHYHSASDHGPLHEHGHAVELHAGALPSEADHDHGITDEETGPAKFTILKHKPASGDDIDFPLAGVALLFFGLVRSRRHPWQPDSLARPASGNDARTPPPRAPPR